MPTRHSIFGGLHCKLGGGRIHRNIFDGVNRVLIEDCTSRLHILFLRILIAGRLAGRLRRSRGGGCRLNGGENVLVGIDKLGGLLDL